MLALVNGHFRFHAAGEPPRRASPLTSPLGLRSLQGWLEAEGMPRPPVINPPPLVCEPGDEVRCAADFLDGLDADTLGISVTAPSLPSALCALRRCERRGRRVILGGPGTQSLPRDFLRDFPEIDVVVHGEGEIALRQALRFLEGAGGVIPGASYRDGDVLRVHTPPERLASLDLLPPLRCEEPASEPLRVVTESSRGCPFQCAFCVAPESWGRRVTLRSTARVISDLTALAARHGRLQVVFADDLLTLSRPRILQLCAGLRAAALPMGWACFARVEGVDEEVLGAMGAAGCQAVSFGLESGSDRVLRRLGKTFTVERARAVVALAARVLPIVECSFIRGFPFETLDDFRSTLELVDHCRGLGAHPKLYTLTPLPGTRLYADFAASWRLDRDRRNPSLAEFHPLSDEVYELLRRCPYLAIPFGYFEDPEHEAKEALLASGLERA